MKALLALAAIAVTAALLRKRRAAPSRSYQSDDSEVVGMPTTVWLGGSISPGVVVKGVDPTGYQCACGAWSRWGETHWCSATSGTTTYWRN